MLKVEEDNPIIFWPWPLTADHEKLFESCRPLRGAGRGLQRGRGLGHGEMSRRSVSLQGCESILWPQQQQQATKVQDIHFQGTEGQKRCGAEGDGLCCGSGQVVCMLRWGQRTVCNPNTNRPQNWMQAPKRDGSRRRWESPLYREKGKTKRLKLVRTLGIIIWFSKLCTWITEDYEQCYKPFVETNCGFEQSKADELVAKVLVGVGGC